VRTPVWQRTQERRDRLRHWRCYRPMATV
jgi:hypothetical protein